MYTKGEYLELGTSDVGDLTVEIHSPSMLEMGENSSVVLSHRNIEKLISTLQCALEEF